MNTIVLEGNISSNIDLAKDKNNKTVATCNLAVKRNFRTQKVDTDFFRLKFIGKTAENLSIYCDKGRPILVRGEIQIDTVEENGKNNYYPTVYVTYVKFLYNKPEEAAETPSEFGEENTPDGELPF